MRRLPCSLIICDIDRFKQINDNFGHQAGDEALKSFAQLLKSCCRPGDLVARYGGEEFVILCADCNISAGCQRAEEMRHAISTLPLPALGGNSITASFGVTSIQAGDTTETMLRRADRALLEAKQRGRNRVVQLGSGSDDAEPQPERRSWFGRRPKPSLVLEKWLVTAVPLKMAVEKIRGFVVDNHADITSLEAASGSCWRSTRAAPGCSNAATTGRCRLRSNCGSPRSWLKSRPANRRPAAGIAEPESTSRSGPNATATGGATILPRRPGRLPSASSRT